MNAAVPSVLEKVNSVFALLTGLVGFELMDTSGAVVSTVHVNVDVV